MLSTVCKDSKGNITVEEIPEAKEHHLAATWWRSRLTQLELCPCGAELRPDWLGAGGPCPSASKRERRGVGGKQIPTSLLANPLRLSIWMEAGVTIPPFAI